MKSLVTLPSLGSCIVAPPGLSFNTWVNRCALPVWQYELPLASYLIGDVGSLPLKWCLIVFSTMLRIALSLKLFAAIV